VKRLFSRVKPWRAIGGNLRRWWRVGRKFLLLTTRETRYKSYTVQAGTPMTVKEIMADELSLSAIFRHCREHTKIAAPNLRSRFMSSHGFLKGGITTRDKGAVFFFTPKCCRQFTDRKPLQNINRNRAFFIPMYHRMQKLARGF
jgi:hypothetical protein